MGTMDGKLVLEKGAYTVRGPCVLTVENGSLEVNGGNASRGSTILIPQGRSALVLVEERASVETTCKAFSRTSREAYINYKLLALKLCGRRALLLGPGDSGKTTLASFTYNICGNSMLTVDVGQNELFSPAYESLARREGHGKEGTVFIPGSTNTVEAENCFVGAFTPRKALSRYLTCASRLSRMATSIVVDTDGWLEPWDGVYSKQALAYSLGTDVTVIIGRLPEKIAGWLKAELPGEKLRVKPLAEETMKTREERRTHRERLLARLLAGSKLYSIPLEPQRVEGAPILVGQRIDLGEPGVLYAEEAPGIGLIVVYRRGWRNTRKTGSVKVLEDGWERGLIAHVECADNSGVPGLVKRILYSKGRIQVYTTCRPEKIVLGRDRVSLAVLGSTDNAG